MPTKLKKLSIKGEKFLYSLSFDIDDSIGDGVWWLQIYDSNKNLIYDKPFVSSINKLETRQIRKIINQEFMTHQGQVL
ncbi:MAG: hypothetical protein ACP5MG_11330 [Verrucomicrobiia bacterium]|jgi:hypothetical protein